MGHAHVSTFCGGCGEKWTFRIEPGVDPYPRECPDCRGELVGLGESMDIARHVKYARYRGQRERDSVRLAYRYAAVTAAIGRDRSGFPPSSELADAREEVVRRYPEMLARWDRANERFIEKVRTKQTRW